MIDRDAAAADVHGRERILVIDDDPHVRLVVERAAARAGFAATCVGDGGVGLALLENESFDAIVLDIGLPSIDGRDVLARLKDSSRWSRIPTVVYSGRASQYDRETLFRLGAEDLIEKPFDAAALVRRVARIVQKQRERH